MKKITYIVRQAKSDFYKIGATVSIGDRIGALQSGNPLLLSLLYTVNQPMGDEPIAETRLHALLRDNRVRGEWFNLPELSVAPNETVLAWMGDIGLEVILQDGVAIWAKNYSSELDTFESEVVDASLVLFLNAQHENGIGYVSLRDFLVGLPQYQHDDIAQGICRLVGLGWIGHSRLPGEDHKFHLNSKPSKERVIFSL